MKGVVLAAQTNEKYHVGDAAPLPHTQGHQPAHGNMVDIIPQNAEMSYRQHVSFTLEIWLHVVIVTFREVHSVKRIVSPCLVARWLKLPEGESIFIRC